jgi:hypothetical protein
MRHTWIDAAGDADHRRHRIVGAICGCPTMRDEQHWGRRLLPCTTPDYGVHFVRTYIREKPDGIVTLAVAVDCVKVPVSGVETTT